MFLEIFRKIKSKKRKVKPKINYLGQFDSLTYKSAGTIRNNGTTYDIFRLEEIGINFDEGKFLTTAFRIKPQNSEHNGHYASVSRHENNGEIIFDLRFEEDIPEDLYRTFFNSFFIPHYIKKLKKQLIPPPQFCLVES